MKNRNSSKLNFTSLPKTYSRLVNLHMLRPVHDHVELKNALEILDVMAGQKLSAEQDDYFEALSTLVEAYEGQQLPATKLSGLELLQHLIEANDMSAADLARLLDCDRSLGVRLLSGERQLNITHLKKLSAHFGLPTQLFLELD